MRILLSFLRSANPGCCAPEQAVARDLESSWNPSFPIKVDKSHFLVTVADRLYPFYRARGSVVKFIVLVGSAKQPPLPPSCLTPPIKYSL